MNKLKEKYCKDSAGNHNESRWRDYQATEHTYGEDLDRLQRNIYNLKEQLEEGVEKDSDILTERLFITTTYYDFVLEKIEKVNRVVSKKSIKKSSKKENK